MIRKTLSLFLCAVMLLGVMCGCDRTPNKRDEYKSLDTDKAAKVALEYMNNKYDKEFQVVSSEKDASHSIVPGVIQDCWCDVEFRIKDSESDETYTVRVANTENEEEYIIKWDNYMTSLVKPWLKEQMDEISDSIFNGDYFSICDQISAANNTVGFPPTFPVFSYNDTIGAVLSANDILACYTINISSRIFSDFTTIDLIRYSFNKVLSGKSIIIRVCVFDDEFYEKYQGFHQNEDGILDGHLKHKILDETIYFE